MISPKKWAVVGAATALGVGGALATASASPLNDRVGVADLDPSAVELTIAPSDAPSDSADSTASADDSPESADSPAESAFDSPESANDSPGDPGYVDPAGTALHSAGSFDSVNSAD